MAAQAQKDAAQAVLALLAGRDAAATICPSEAARALTGPDGDWRAAMLRVHAAVDGLVADGSVRLSWKGEPLASRSGPYRVARTSP